VAHVEPGEPEELRCVQQQRDQDDAAADPEQARQEAPDEAEGGQDTEEHGARSIARGSHPHNRHRGVASRAPSGPSLPGARLSSSRGRAKITRVDASFLPLAATALLAGLGFGDVAQRGGFCLRRALSNLGLMGDGTIARAYVLALVVAVVGTFLLTAAGTHLPLLEFAEEIPVRPFRWLANLVGGFIFGIGIVLSGGCAGSTWYRLGGGAAVGGVGPPPLATRA